MGTAAARVRLTPQEYLAMERASAIKHELANGEIVAMPGATFEHSAICSPRRRRPGSRQITGTFNVWRKARAEYPELSRAPNLFVLADEARRAHEPSATPLS